MPMTIEQFAEMSSTDAMAACGYAHARDEYTHIDSRHTVTKAGGVVGRYTAWESWDLIRAELGLPPQNGGLL